MFFFTASGEDAPSTFEERLDKAYRTSSLTPEKVHGRNVWISQKLGERGITVSPESVRKWHAGLTRPRGETLEALAQVLGVSVDWLENGTVQGQPLGSADKSDPDVEFPWDGDEIFDVDFDSLEKTWLGAESSQEERENSIAASSSPPACSGRASSTGTAGPGFSWSRAPRRVRSPSSRCTPLRTVAGRGSHAYPRPEVGSSPTRPASMCWFLSCPGVAATRGYSRYSGRPPRDWASPAIRLTYPSRLLTA